MKKQKVIVLILFLFLISIAFAQEERLLIKSFELDNKLEIIGVGVITNNNFYSHYYSDTFKQETTNYTVEFYKDKILKNSISIMNTAFTLIEFDESVYESNIMVVKKNNVLLNSKKLNFCNNNNVCEPCLSPDCINQENELVCADCSYGGKDNYCNLFDDQICDSDCATGYEYLEQNSYEGCYEEQFFYKTCEEKGAIQCTGIQNCIGQGSYVDLDNCCYDGVCIASTEPEDLSIQACLLELGEYCNLGWSCTGESFVLNNGHVCCTVGKCIDNIVIETKYDNLTLEPDPEEKDYTNLILMLIIILIIILIIFLSKYFKDKKFITISLFGVVLFSFVLLGLINSNSITGRVTDDSVVMQEFPELFIYHDAKNQNLLKILKDLTVEFKNKDIEMTPEVLVASVITMEKEVGHTNFLPVEEYGDYCSGPICTYKVGGVCRRSEYEGGCDYKGRGYIQITHKENYERFGGTEFLSSKKDECKCVGLDYCKNQECNPAKALKHEYAIQIFAYYYDFYSLADYANKKDFYNVGLRINGGKSYAKNFEERANQKYAAIKSNKNALEGFLKYLKDGDFELPDDEPDEPDPTKPGSDKTSATKIPDEVLTGITSGYYYLNPSVRMQHQIDLSEIYEEMTFSSDLIKQSLACKTDSNTYWDCAQDVLNSNGRDDWILGGCDSPVKTTNNKIKVCVKTNQFVRIFENNEYINKPLNLKFALTFDETGIADLGTFEYDDITEPQEILEYYPIENDEKPPSKVDIDVKLAEEKIEETLKGCYGSVDFKSMSSEEEIIINKDANLNPMSAFKGLLAGYYYMSVDQTDWIDAKNTMQLMLVESDNHATTKIFKRIQDYALTESDNVMEEFNKFLDENGLSKTYIYSWNFPVDGYFPYTEEYNVECYSYIDKEGSDKKTTVASDCEKTSTAHELALFYQLLYDRELKLDGKLISQEQRDTIINSLKKTDSYTFGFSDSFEMGAKFHTKGGSHANPPNPWPHNIYVDAGIIKTEHGDFSFGVMMMDCKDYTTTRAKVKEIAKIISDSIEVIEDKVEEETQGEIEIEDPGIEPVTVVPDTTLTLKPWLSIPLPITNKMSQRDPIEYSKIIDQFGVESNPRYEVNQKGIDDSYCNIFAWDVTKAMDAQIPHWINSNGQPVNDFEGNELSANMLIEWLDEYGEDYGWHQINMVNAQNRANSGYPTVAVKHRGMEIGHIAMVRPGELNSLNGPTTAQAGGINFNDGDVKKGFSTLDVRYFTHD